jgi:IS1 family transposase
VGNKKHDQWLWVVMHTDTRQILAFHVGNRTKASGEALMAKLPLDLKKSTLLHRYILSLF